MLAEPTLTLWRDAGAGTCVRIRRGGGCNRCPRLHWADVGSIAMEQPDPGTLPTRTALSCADSPLGTNDGPESTARRCPERDRQDKTMHHAPAKATASPASSAIAADDGEAAATVVTQSAASSTA